MHTEAKERPVRSRAPAARPERGEISGDGGYGSPGRALIEHRWAIPLRDAIHKTGGRTLADAWIHPDDPVLGRLEGIAKRATVEYDG